MMKSLSELITKNKLKVLALLLCFITLILTYICHSNNNKIVATQSKSKQEVQAQQETVPEGYIGITSPEELANIKNDLSSNYILMADLDMTNIAFEPIGTSSAPFKGIFDGNYHKISNLKIESNNQYVGMFGNISGGTIRNLTLENVNVKGTNYVGGLAGYKSGTITNVGITGEVIGTTNVGGLIGYNTGNITDAYSITKVTGTTNVGGLVGSIYTGTITNTYAVGELNGNSNVGGLIGGKGGTITNSYYSIDKKGQMTSTSGEGRFLSVMLKEATFKNWGFGTVWQIEEGATLPYLKGMEKPEAVKSENYTYTEWEGEGTQENPYLVKTPEHLREVNKFPSAYYRLANDIDMQDEEYEIVKPTSTISYISFTGTFDGNGHKISNLKIESSNQYIGMFEYINGGTIKNLGLENVNIRYIGTDNNTYTGGLVGYINNGTITNVYVTGQVEGTNNVGGIAGCLWSGSINNSYSAANVTGINNVGGIAGYNNSSNNGTIANSYVTGQIEGTNYVGGIAGWGRLTITNTYVVGKIKSTGTSVGGIIGWHNGTVTNSYYAIDTTEQAAGTVGEGKFLSTMLKQATFKNWKFGTIWQIEEGTTLPYLIGMEKPEAVKKENYTYTQWEGEGTSTSPYLIKTPEHLREINNSLSSYYQLVNNIDMTDELFEPIGTSLRPFKGTFDGNGHKISNLKIESSNQKVGMFGYVSSGTIKNLGLENVNITSLKTDSDSNTGGLIGENYQGTITNIYTTGKVTSENEGWSRTGGLIGYNIGNITNAYSTVEVKGKVYVGGLVGQNHTNGRISNTYSTGKVTQSATNTAIVGGLVGSNAGTVSNSYWSLDTSGQTKSDGGEGKTTHELLQQSTYKNWPFDTIWKIEEGHTLAYLKEMTKQEIVYIDFEGHGTVESPYLIKTPEQLQKIKYVPSANYQLENDIDTSEIKDFKLDIANFKGILDGNNHSINNLIIKSDNDYIGLFERNDGTIKNLKLNNVNIESSYSGETAYIGGICAYNNGTIKNIEVSGTIKNIGTVDNLHMGQITGYNMGTINKTHSNGTLTNEATVTNGYIGGISGFNNGKITISYNTGNIFVQNIENLKIGGIAGKSSKTLKDSYSQGNINVNVKTATIGGIAGEATGFITNTYSLDKIEKVVETEAIGGIVGTNKNATIVSSYYNNSNILEQKEKGILKTIEELKQQYTFEDWNFDDIWYIEEDKATPIFKDIFNNDDDYYNENEYETDGFWEWHTRTTTDDQAYNGKHIVINKGHSINFYGYGVTSYKDYLYKYYTSAGEKTFMFTIDETKASYHTLDGAGFIFNASKQNNLLSGYVLLIKEKDICIYRLEKVDATKFETSSNSVIASYGTLIASASKTSSTMHNLIVKTSPTNVTVIDNEEEILNTTLDYSKHSGEDFGLIASYAQHDCSILSEIQFLAFALEVKDYSISVLKTDENGKRLADAKFQVKDEAGEIIREGSTNSSGIYKIQGLQKGIYTIEEIEAPAKHTFKNSSIRFEFTNDGKVINPDTKEEMEIKFINEALKFEVKVVDTKGNPIPNSKVNLYDEEGNVVLGSDGQPIVVITTSDGTATITDIEAGTYTFKQTETPSDYILNDTVYTVEIEKDGTVTFREEENGVIVNKKYGNVIIKKYIKGTTQGLEGAVIEIKDASGNSVKLTTNENGIITFKAFPGTYTYKEITAPIGYVLNDTEYTFTSADDGTVTYDSAKGIIYNDRVTMLEALTITKYKTNTTIPLPGATIAVFDSNENKVAEKVTGENGQVSFTGLEVGSYYYKEISAPAGYILNNTEYHFTVNNDGSVTLGEGTTKVIYNTRVTMGEDDNFTIIKYRTGTEVALSGAVIGIFDAEGNELSRQTTGENGRITISGLEVGSYYYKEISAPAGYVLNDTEYHFTVNNDGSVTFAKNANKVIYNDRVTMTDGITITKKRTGTETLLPGATIGIFDASGKEIERKTTGENGAVSFTGLEVGSYYYKEISAPAGYVLNDTEYHFTVNNDGSVTLANNQDKIIYNDRVTMREGITITKKRTGTETLLPGAVIGIFDASGKEIARKTTGENGAVSFTGLEVGSYYYKEISAPAGYVLNDTEYHFTVNNDGSVTLGEGTTKVIYNDRVTMSEGITITKKRTGTETLLPGAVIGIFDASGKEIARKTTNENGAVSFAGLEVGSYYYKEISAPAGYVLNDTEYHFTVNNDGSVTLANNQDKIIYNDRVTMREGITITKKRTGTETLLPGAVIGIFDAEGNEIKRGTTNENGVILFSGLEVGSYYYKEISAPAGYVLNSTEYHFTVNNDGTVTFANNQDKIIYNDRVTMRDGITITKKRTGTETLLPGAVIGIFDAEGNEIKRGTTNENGAISFSGLEVGSYYYKEISAPAGYVLNDTEYHFTVNNDGSVTFANNQDKIIYNDRVTMREGITITKKRTGTETLLPGAVIGIFDADGNEIKRGTTNENGAISFSGLEVGSYYYKEISAPAGYVLNSTEYHFTVNNDGTVTLGEGTTKVIYNDRELVYGDVTITKYIKDTTTPLAGAVIAICKEDGTPMLDKEGNPVQITTSELGTITFKITPGKYYYKEVKAPTGYKLNNTTYSFTVSEDGIVTYDSANGIIYNDKVTMEDDLTITKYKTNTTIPLPGAKIAIFDTNGHKIKEAITKEDGTVTFTGLEVGSYYYKEISAPAGYVLNSTEYRFTVNSDGTVTFANGVNKIIYNDRVKVENVIITKYRTNTTIPLPGAVIGLFDGNGNEIVVNGEQIKLTTDNNGQVNFTGLEVGTYKYKELVAPEGYKLNETMYTFTVNDDGTVTFDNANGIIYDDRVIMEDDLVITKKKTETDILLPGAVIGIFNEDGEEIERKTTGKNGTVTFTGLEVGNYYYKEITSPSGYVLNNTEYHFTVNNDGTVTLADGSNRIIYNDAITADHIIITKYITNTVTPIPGATIGLFDMDGNKLQEKITNEKGQVDFEGLEPGTYQYKELIAPNGYILNDTTYTFEIAQDGTVTFDSANAIIYDDKEIIYTDVILTKYEEGTKTPVPGAIIAIYDSKGNILKDADGNEMKFTTNKDGVITFKLAPGTYQYKEIQAPEGYILNETTYTFTVAEDGRVTFKEGTNGIIYNKKKEDKPDKPDIYGDITLTKYEEGTTLRIEGAIIGIYDVNGNPIKNSEGNVIQFITNQYGEVKFKAKPGTYIYKEIKAPDGYILNETIYTFTVAEDGTVTFKENTNGIIYNKKKEDEPYKPDINVDVTLIKYEEGTTIKLSGAVIGIYDSQKNEIKVTTNDNGEAKFKLKPGVYQYQELVAPKGYILDNTIYTFTVTEKGEVIFDKDTKGIIYNKKEEEKPEEPDTPDVPDKPTTPEDPKGNVIIPGENTIVQDPAENIVSGKLPQTGETEGTVIIALILAVFGIYFGIKIRDKQ